MKKPIIFCLLMSFGLLMAQSFSKQEIRKLENADIDFEIGDFKSAAEVYIEILKSHPDDADLNLKTGICYFKLRQAEKSMSYLESAKEQGAFESMFYLGQVYHLDGRLEEELELYQKYKNQTGEKAHSIEEVDRLIAISNNAKELMDNPVNVDIVNFGASINTPYHEYVPLIYGAEDEIYFTSRRPGSTGGELDHRGDYFEDVYFSRMQYGFWQNPEQLGPTINTATHDACVGISADGQILYIFRTSEDLVSGDLYVSMMDEGGWSPMKKLGSDINSEFIETSACISADNNTLYFSSNREGGYGGMDLYKVVRLPNGEWSLAQNLGPTINSKYDEDSPFIHADNSTLYFISNGHKTMGGYDIFQSTLKSDGLWTEPSNMGYPINSLNNDMNFVMSSDKQTGYYSSSARGGFGGQDIYKINFKLSAQILSIVKGGVISDGASHSPIAADITLIDVKTKTVQGSYKTNESNGKFIMLITPESTYQVMVEADGYHTYSGELYFGTDVLVESNIKEFVLVPMEVVIND